MRVFLCGDLMLGRGVDQILPSPSSPQLHEPYVTDARQYVALAEETNGTLPRAVPPAYIWGDLPEVLAVEAPDVRIGNLETSITTRDDYVREKGIHYRMSPANVEALAAPGFDCLTLANNHVLDWGTAGLEETLDTLRRAGIGYCGAGRDLEEAASPWVVPLSSGGSLEVRGVGDRSSGIPRSWGARADRPGVWLKPSTRELKAEIAGRGSTLSRGTLRRDTPASDDVPLPDHIPPLAARVRILSIHWGENWGYAIPARQRKLARTLIDTAGVSIVHGHSSHHLKGFELHNGALILYGSGDFINDYEGIGGRERYRPDLTAGYIVDVDEATGRVRRARALVFRVRRFRLERASAADTEWLAEMLHRVSPPGVRTCRVERHGVVELYCDESAGSGACGGI